MTALKDQVVLVTGGARRVGAAIVREFASRGARVVIHHHRSEAEARALAADVAKSGGRAELAQADLRDSREIQLMVRDIEVRVGYVDVLVNNASTFFETPLASTSDAEFAELIDVNLRAPFLLARRIAPTMTNRGRGAIVNLVDVYAEKYLRGHLVYCVAKAGLEMMTKGLARELAPAVRVFGVAPGTVLFPDDYPEEKRERLRRSIPLGREGAPEDVARAARFLVEEGDYVTGAILRVDGGKGIA